MALRNEKVTRLEQAGHCGIWRSMAPLKLGGKCCSFNGLMDALRQRYGLKLLGICKACDGCGAPFTIAHALSCKKGGLVSIRHNNARDEAGADAMYVLQGSKVTYEPTINNGRRLNDTTHRRTTEATGN